MLEFMNPPKAPAPFSRYSQAVAAPEGYRWLHIAGQVGCDLDHKIGTGFEAQAALAWKNVIAVIEGGGMTVKDLVKVNIFLTRQSDVGASRVARDNALQGAAPASTLLIVAGLAHPDMLIEVEAIAARAN